MKTRKSKRAKKKKMSRWAKAGIIVLVLAMIAVLTGAWWVFFGRQSSFTGENVELKLSGPTEAGVGELVTYTINYANNEQVVLEDVTISLIYPEGFSFTMASESSSNFGDNKWEIGTLAAGASGSLSIKGNLYGNAGSEQTCAVSMTYQPENINSSFAEHKQFTSKISSRDISLETDIPSSVQRDTEFEFPVKLKNITQSDLVNVRVKISWPSKFQFISADPTPKVSGTWDISKLKMGETEEIKIKGKITDDTDDADKIKVQAGLFDEQDSFYFQTEKETAVKVVDISGELKLLVNNKESLNVNPGAQLDMILTYKNTGSESLEETNISLELENSDLLDSDSVEVNQGIYQDGKIVWDKGGVKELTKIEPDRAGALAVKAKIIAPLPVKELTDENFSLKLTPKLTSKRSGEPEVKISGSSVEIKVNSEVALNAEARFNDYSGKQIGTGSVPPQVGKKTTYRVYLTLGNRTNEVSNGRVEVNLGKIAKWTGVKSTSVGDLKYEGGKVIWDVGRIPSNTGQFTENLKANFEVSITPRAADVGKTVELVSGSSFTGSDVFTGVKLTAKSGALDTNLSGDFISKGKGKVVE